MKFNIINLLILTFFFIFSLILGKLSFTILLCILAILSLRELYYIRNKEKPFPIEIELISYVIIIFFIINNYDNSLDYYLIDYKLLVLLLLFSFIPLVLINNKKKYNLIDSLYLFGSILFIGISFNLLSQYRSNNIYYVSYIIFIGINSYLFEQITTYLIGKRKFLPTIEPKKTIEGIFGGLIISTIFSSLFLIRTITTNLPIYAVVIISFILALVGELGGLIFSFIKKEFNKSNFSNYIFINSGILDIIDRIIFITLMFLLFVSII